MQKLIRRMKPAHRGQMIFVQLTLAMAIVGIISFFSVTPGLLGKTENPLTRSGAIKDAMTVQKAMRQIYDEVNPAVVRIETESSVNAIPSTTPFSDSFSICPEAAKIQKESSRGLAPDLYSTQKRATSLPTTM